MELPVGHSRRMAQLARATLLHKLDHRPIPAKIVHFTSARKPRGRLGKWCLGMSGAKTLPAIRRYRMGERRLSKFLGEGDLIEK